MAVRQRHLLARGHGQRRSVLGRDRHLPFVDADDGRFVPFLHRILCPVRPDPVFYLVQVHRDRLGDGLSRRAELFLDDVHRPLFQTHLDELLSGAGIWFRGCWWRRDSRTVIAGQGLGVGLQCVDFRLQARDLCQPCGDLALVLVSQALHLQRVLGLLGLDRREC